MNDPSFWHRNARSGAPEVQDQAHFTGSVDPMAADPQGLVAIGRAVIVAAMSHLRRSFESRPAARAKSRGDYVTAMDLAIEDLIAAEVLRARPYDAVVGEEGTSREGITGIEWIIDPIDGTLQFLRAEAGFVISLAARRGQQVLAAVVGDPVSGAVFWSAHGIGSYRDGLRLHGPAPADPSDAIVSTGFASSPLARKQQAEIVGRLSEFTRHVRVFGSAGYEMCRLAAGSVDAYVETSLALWDALPGAAIAAQAGCQVEILEQPDRGYTVIAAPPDLYRPLRSIVLPLVTAAAP